MSDFNLESLNTIAQKDSVNISKNKIINEKYSNFVNCYYVSNNAVEIISNKTNKSNAIQLLIDRLKIDNNNVYTIGDGYSDIEMVRDF